eukprot:TRINITY_DN6323_c0_g1_i1.p1 TRINITY_DN6323_c0_g1~~TRINITY_DN6323_c0_g1_i1.p1  ORF type:complete len:291 (+),score=74.77 TRINITY_DN6323_c0_g1_i1:38-874(+)
MEVIMQPLDAQVKRRLAKLRLVLAFQALVCITVTGLDFARNYYMGFWVYAILPFWAAFVLAIGLSGARRAGNSTLLRIYGFLAILTGIGTGVVFIDLIILVVGGPDEFEYYEDPVTCYRLTVAEVSMMVVQGIIYLGTAFMALGLARAIAPQHHYQQSYGAVYETVPTVVITTQPSRQPVKETYEAPASPPPYGVVVPPTYQQPYPYPAPVGAAYAAPYPPQYVYPYPAPATAGDASAAAPPAEAPQTQQPQQPVPYSAPYPQPVYGAYVAPPPAQQQ